MGTKVTEAVEMVAAKKGKEGRGEVSGKEKVPWGHICVRQAFGELKLHHKSRALTVTVSQLESQGPLSHTGHFSLPGKPDSDTVKMGEMSKERSIREKRKEAGAKS